MNTFFPNWQDKVVFGDAGPQPTVLLENDKMKVILGGLNAGQQIPAHPESLATYHILEGSGWITVDDDRHAVEAGAIIITPEGSTRGVEAETKLVFLAVRVA